MTKVQVHIVKATSIVLSFQQTVDDRLSFSDLFLRLQNEKGICGSFDDTEVFLVGKTAFSSSIEETIRLDHPEQKVICDVCFNANLYDSGPPVVQFHLCDAVVGAPAPQAVTNLQQETPTTALVAVPVAVVGGGTEESAKQISSEVTTGVLPVLVSVLPAVSTSTSAFIINNQQHSICTPPHRHQHHQQQQQCVSDPPSPAVSYTLTMKFQKEFLATADIIAATDFSRFPLPEKVLIDWQFNMKPERYKLYLDAGMLDPQYGIDAGNMAVFIVTPAAAAELLPVGFYNKIDNGGAFTHIGDYYQMLIVFRKTDYLLSDLKRALETSKAAAITTVRRLSFISGLDGDNTTLTEGEDDGDESGTGMSWLFSGEVIFMLAIRKIKPEPHRARSHHPPLVHVAPTTTTATTAAAATSSPSSRESIEQPRELAAGKAFDNPPRIPSTTYLINADVVTTATTASTTASCSKAEQPYLGTNEQPPSNVTAPPSVSASISTEPPAHLLAAAAVSSELSFDDVFFPPVKPYKPIYAPTSISQIASASADDVTVVVNNNSISATADTAPYIIGESSSPTGPPVPAAAMTTGVSILKDPNRSAAVSSLSAGASAAVQASNKQKSRRVAFATADNVHVFETAPPLLINYDDDEVDNFSADDPHDLRDEMQGDDGKRSGKIKKRYDMSMKEIKNVVRSSHDRDDDQDEDDSDSYHYSSRRRQHDDDIADAVTTVTVGKNKGSKTTKKRKNTNDIYRDDDKSTRDGGKKRKNRKADDREVCSCCGRKGHVFVDCWYRLHPHCNTDSRVCWTESAMGKAWAAIEQYTLPHNRLLDGRPWRSDKVSSYSSSSSPSSNAVAKPSAFSTASSVVSGSTASTKSGSSNDEAMPASKKQKSSFGMGTGYLPCSCCGRVGHLRDKCRLGNHPDSNPMDRMAWADSEKGRAWAAKGEPKLPFQSRLDGSFWRGAPPPTGSTATAGGAAGSGSGSSGYLYDEMQPAVGEKRKAVYGLDTFDVSSDSHSSSGKIRYTSSSALSSSSHDNDSSGGDGSSSGGGDGGPVLVSGGGGSPTGGTSSSGYTADIAAAYYHRRILARNEEEECHRRGALENMMMMEEDRGASCGTSDDGVYDGEAAEEEDGDDEQNGGMNDLTEIIREQERERHEIAASYIYTAHSEEQDDGDDDEFIFTEDHETMATMTIRSVVSIGDDGYISTEMATAPTAMAIDADDEGIEEDGGRDVYRDENEVISEKAEKSAVVAEEKAESVPTEGSISEEEEDERLIEVLVSLVTFCERVRHMTFEQFEHFVRNDFESYYFEALIAPHHHSSSTNQRRRLIISRKDVLYCCQDEQIMSFADRLFPAADDDHTAHAGGGSVFSSAPTSSSSSSLSSSGSRSSEVKVEEEDAEVEEEGEGVVKETNAKEKETEEKNHVPHTSSQYVSSRSASTSPSSSSSTSSSSSASALSIVSERNFSTVVNESNNDRDDDDDGTAKELTIEEKIEKVLAGYDQAAREEFAKSCLSVTPYFRTCIIQPRDIEAFVHQCQPLARVFRAADLLGASSHSKYSILDILMACPPLFRWKSHFLSKKDQNRMRYAFQKREEEDKIINKKIDEQLLCENRYFNEKFEQELACLSAFLNSHNGILSCRMDFLFFMSDECYTMLDVFGEKKTGLMSGIDVVNICMGYYRLKNTFRISGHVPMVEEPPSPRRESEDDEEQHSENEEEEEEEEKEEEEVERVLTIDEKIEKAISVSLSFRRNYENALWLLLTHLHALERRVMRVEDFRYFVHDSCKPMVAAFYKAELLQNGRYLYDVFKGSESLQKHFFFDTDAQVIGLFELPAEDTVKTSQILIQKKRGRKEQRKRQKQQQQGLDRQQQQPELERLENLFTSLDEQNAFKFNIKQLKYYLKENGGRMSVSNGNKFIKNELRAVVSVMFRETGNFSTGYKFFERYANFGIFVHPPINGKSAKQSDRIPHYALYAAASPKDDNKDKDKPLPNKDKVGLGNNKGQSSSSSQHGN